MRNETTKEYYPEKMNIEDFLNEVTDGMCLFSENMRNLERVDEKYAEDWMELFTNWMEMSKNS
jgi:hypothetical protein